MTTTLKPYALAVASFAFAFNVSAANWTKSGSTLTDSETGWTITVDSATAVDNLTLQGIGAVPENTTELNLSALNGTDSQYTLVKVGKSYLLGSGTGSKQITKVVLPETVTELAKECFRQHGYLQTIEMPGVEVINNHAFYSVKTLTCSLSMPHVKHIGTGAFDQTGVTGLLSLPCVTNIGVYAFNKTRIEDAYLPWRF